MDAFKERMAEKKKQEEAEAEELRLKKEREEKERVETLQSAYLRRTGRTEFKP